jgi:hypothetical protein
MTYLPVGGVQNRPVVRVGHGWQAFKNVGEAGFRVVAATYGAFDQGVDDGGSLAAGFSAND